MDYFKINYNKLQNLPQIKFFKIVFLILILVLLLMGLSLSKEIYSTNSCYGIYSNKSLILEINSELSDIVKRSDYITFNDRKTEFQIKGFGEYEIIDDVIYQEVELVMDKEFYDNEVGIVTFHYDKKSIFKYILDLFK